MINYKKSLNQYTRPGKKLPIMKMNFRKSKKSTNIRSGSKWKNL